MKRLVLVLVLALAPLAGLAGLTPAATAGDPMAGAPTVGQCADYGWKTYMAEVNKARPVRCSSTHTAEVVAVRMLPDGVSYDDTEAVFKAMYRGCTTAVRERLGRTHEARHLSRYSLAWFVPSKAQRENGARWVRCDVVLPATSSLLTIPHTKQLISAPITDKQRLCMTKSELSTSCAKSHAYRAVTTVRIARDAYPGPTRLSALAQRKCRDAIGTGGYAWWPPSKLAWNRLGERHVVCGREA